MDTKRNEQRKEWLKKHPETEKKPSMLRRKSDHDYQQPYIYMITIVVKDHRPLLGSLKAPDGNHPRPWIELTALGNAVKDEWNNIHVHHPEIKLYALQIMPDHLHAIIHVTERMPQHLGKIMGYFKKDSNKCYDGQLWEESYHDRILQRAGQLKQMCNYVKDNPYRLWLKRSQPDYFTVYHNITIGDTQVEIMGNRFLLNHPVKEQVQCSRKMTEEEIEAQRQRLRDCDNKDIVLVSPCISNGEKEIMKCGFQEGYPQIILLENGFAKHQKPQGRQFKACSEGRLLLVAPWPHHNERIKITRQQCNQLNELARKIVEEL